MRKLVIAWLLQIGLLTHAEAGGPEGHSIVAEIAQRRLTPAAGLRLARTLNDALRWPNGRKHNPSFRTRVTALLSHRTFHENTKNATTKVSTAAIQKVSK
jgi:hypothetical protein